MDLRIDLAEIGIEQQSECDKCGLSLKNGRNICERCEKSKIFLESVHINVDDIKNKMFVLIQDVKKEIPIPEKGKQVRIRTQVSMNMLAVLLKILDKHKKIDDLVIATYSFDRNSVIAVLDLFKAGKIKSFGLLLSDTYSYRYKNLYEKIKKEMLFLKKSGLNCWLVFATNHMKITLIKCKGNYYQIEGSMNYSVNNLCEQVSIENCKETYDRDFKLLSEIIPSFENFALERVC